MPLTLEKWVKGIKESLRKTHPDWSEERINSTAWGIAVNRWKEKYGKAP